jgi:predicted O-methyltransferase YrrM
MTPSTEAISPRNKVIAELRTLAPNIDKWTEQVLADMYSAKQLSGTVSDQPVNINAQTRIPIAEGAQLNQIVRQSKTIKSLEIGFAYGFSTVWILDALRARDGSRHIAIDPFEVTWWGGVGLQQVKRLCAGPGFEWIGEESIHALSRLIKNEERFDFIFIDGNHRFDDVLVDFYLCDQLVSPGGLIIFDDASWPSVRTVINFILTNREYKLIPQSVQSMTVLKKLADDNRHWEHFQNFKVGNPRRTLRQIVWRIKKPIDP